MRERDLPVGGEIGDDWFATDMSEETAHRSTLAEHPVGAGVNLELPLRIGDSLDGHLVQGHTDAVGKVTAIEDSDGGRRVWIRPPRRLMDEVVAKGSVAVDGVSLTAAEVLQDRFSVALIPITFRETTLGSLQVDDRVNLESDLFVKSARELHGAAGLVASRSFAALPWAGELRGVAGVEKTAAQLAAGGAVIIYDPDREAEADVVFAGAGLRPESFVFLLTQVCGHTTVPCDRERLERLEIPPMPGSGDRTARPTTSRWTWPPARVRASLPSTGPQRCAGWQTSAPALRTSYARATSFRWPEDPVACSSARPHRSLIGTVRCRGASRRGGHLRGNGA